MKKENKKILRLVIVLMILSILLTLGLFLLFQGDSPEKKQEAEQSSASDQTAGSDSVNLQPEETADTPQRRIATIVAAMSLEEKVGQLFFTRCPETEALQSIAEYHLGGYILFARDFKEKSPQQVIDEIEAYQQEAEIPLLIGVDEEGGTVNRISLYSQFRAVPFWSPRDLYQKGGLDLIRQDTKEKCDLLTSLGINVNLAPVCDVSTDRESYMYARTFGGDGEETAGYVGNGGKGDERK